jgi:putative transposase
MKRSKFTDSQIMDALKRVDAGLAVPEVYREPSISTPLFISGVQNMVVCTPP